MSKREFAAKLSEVTVHERIFGNWAIPLATYRSLETEIVTAPENTSLYG